MSMKKQILEVMLDSNCITNGN